jgi:hypothetical protein
MGRGWARVDSEDRPRRTITEILLLLLAILTTAGPLFIMPWLGFRFAK